MHKYIIGSLDNAFKLIDKIDKFDIVLIDDIDVLKRYKKEVLEKVKEDTFLILDIDKNLDVKEIKFFGLKLILKEKFDNRYVYIFNKDISLIKCLENMSFVDVYELIGFILNNSSSNKILDLTNKDFLSNCFINNNVNYVGFGKEKILFFTKCQINGNKIKFIYIK